MSNSVLVKTGFMDYLRMYLSFREISHSKIECLEDYRKHDLQYIYFILYKKTQN